MQDHTLDRSLTSSKFVSVSPHTQLCSKSSWLSCPFAIKLQVFLTTIISLHHPVKGLLAVPQAVGFSIFVYSDHSTWKALLPLPSLVCSEPILNTICTIKHTCTHTSLLLFIFASLLLPFMALYTFMALGLLCLKNPMKLFWDHWDLQKVKEMIQSDPLYPLVSFLQW